ncbi:MAG: protein kinase domain-containing protein, partial [Persicimonas sp.]
MSSQPEAPNLKPGDVVAGRFRIVESIGSGGFSVVYRAHQEDQNRFVALKVLKPDASSDDDIVERFRREALYASHLSHPNTITLFDYGHTDEGLCYIAMEHLEGCDLADIVKHGEPMDLRRVWSILMQTSRSLAEAHQIGLVHRDLKPENIFLVQRDGSEEMVKVLDFGVSKAISNFGDRGVETMKPLTQQGTVFGTPLYMAPEQAMAEDITPAVDVYALGHIAYEMITGEAAYLDCSTAMDVMLKQINEPPLSLPKPWAQTPFSALITRCTIKDPDERIADASVLLEHLMHEAFSGYVSDVRRTGRTHSLPNVATQTDEGTIEEPSQPLASNEIESVYRWELDALDEVLEEVVTQGQMRLVLVRGTPGSGRSNLLRAFLQRRLDSTDQLAVAHRPRTEDAGLAADLAAVTSTDIEGRGVDELRRMLSAAPVDDVAAESNPQTDSAPLSALGARRDKLLVRVGEAFRHAANSSGGLIWAIESLERVDTLTLAFLEHLFEDLKRRPAPVLIVATVHPDDLRRRPGLLRYTQSLLRARRPVARQLEILPPGEDKAIDEEAPAPPEERGAPRPSGGSYVGDELPRLDRGIGAEASQPEEVFGDLRADSVPRRQEGELAFETILGFLSELGDRVDRDLWKLACARVIPDEFVGMIDFILQQAKRYGIIAEEEGAYVFTQEGYAEQLRASFDDLVDSAEVHRRLARLMREHSDSLERTELQAIVRHLRLGHAPFEAVELLREAGEAAFRSYDLDSARGYYLQIRQILEDVDRGRLPSEAERVELGERERAKIWLRLGEIHGAMDEHGAAEDAIGRTLAPDSGADAELRGRAYKILGDLAASQDRYDRAKLEYRRARDSFREAGHPGAFAAAVGAMGHCALEQGKAREAEELVAMALERAAEIQNEMLGARLGRIMGRVLLIQGRIKEARTHFDRSSERFERVDSRREMAATLAELATATFADGHFDEARDNYGRAQAIAG